MLCGGEPALKARVFYDVLQDNMQQRISSGDKDFDQTFKDMIKLSCYMMLRMFRMEAANAEGRKYLTKHYPNPDPPQDQPNPDFNNKLNDFKEAFLDEIFGDESNVSREQFLMTVETKGTWIF